MSIHFTIAKNVIGKKILDIGFAQRPNYHIKSKYLYGIDIQKVKKPESYIEVKCVNLNNNPIPYKDTFFDTVILADTIEHVENPSQLLRECNRVLKGGGRIIISTPQANYFYDFIKNFLYSFCDLNLDRDPGSHLSNWTIIDFVRLLKKNSFKLKKIVGGYIHFPFGINLPVPLFPILGWQVIYVADKIGAPYKWIYTKNEKNVHFLIN